MQRVQVRFAPQGEGAPVREQGEGDHPGILPTEVAEIIAALRAERLPDPDISHEQEHHEVDRDDAEAVLLREGHVLDEGEGQVRQCHISVEQRPDPVPENQEQDQEQERDALEQDIPVAQLHLGCAGEGRRNDPPDVLRGEVARGERHQHRLREQQQGEEPPACRNLFQFLHFIFRYKNAGPRRRRRRPRGPRR